MSTITWSMFILLDDDDSSWSIFIEEDDDDDVPWRSVVLIFRGKSPMENFFNDCSNDDYVVLCNVAGHDCLLGT